MGSEHDALGELLGKPDALRATLQQQEATLDATVATLRRLSAEISAQAQALPTGLLVAAANTTQAHQALDEVRRKVRELLQLVKQYHVPLGQAFETIELTSRMLPPAQES